MTSSPRSSDPSLAALLAQLTPLELQQFLGSMPDAALPALLEMLPTIGTTPTQMARIPDSVVGQATDLDNLYLARPHLVHLDTRLQAALSDLEAGISRRILVSMPPRTGKSTMISIYLVIWLLRRHPDWKFIIVSHGETLATDWGRSIRRAATGNPELGISIAPDAGAVSNWQTIQGGTVVARGLGGDLTGRGAKVLIVDDPHKGFLEVMSEAHRDAVWAHWTGTLQPRLEFPDLVVVVQTRWHQDDFAGRLLSREFEGDPAAWEQIRLPAFATDNDPLGRAPGEPLLSPLDPADTTERATARWEQIRRDVGTAAFSAIYQQEPAPVTGTIFHTGWFRFWADDPELVAGDGTGRTVHLDPATLSGSWVDSLDAAFKDTSSSDYVVNQRWCRSGPDRYLVWQARGRMSFTATLEMMRDWASPSSRFGARVHLRLVEDKANGSAIIDTLRREIAGVVPVNPTNSKAARAQAVTPECESGNVYLPHPSMPGYEWVLDLLHELANFPKGSHDDQVDALTQALWRQRDLGAGSVTNPNDHPVPPADRLPPSVRALVSARVPERARPGARPTGSPSVRR